MSLRGQSFISSSQLRSEEVDLLFNRTALFKDHFKKHGRIEDLISGTAHRDMLVAMVFGEPSTRTRSSFQVACARLGMKTIILDNMAVSSVSKGETLEDTFRNVASMWPNAMVLRYGGSVETPDMISELKCPVISAGIGTSEHPTQALLDAFTILENRKKISGEKVLLVGDVLHSRVANSNLILLKKLGAEVAYCTPAEFTPREDQWKGVQHFAELNEGMKWATVVMGLRIQKERHQSGIGLSIAEYRERYRIGGDELKLFSNDGIILHPGPVIRGVEFSPNVMIDPRNRILDQVTNGVFLRAALLSFILGLEVNT